MYIYIIYIYRYPPNPGGSWRVQKDTKMIRSMAQSKSLGLSRGGVQNLEPGFGRTQRPENYRYHLYTSTRAIEDFLRILETLQTIHRK